MGNRKIVCSRWGGPQKTKPERAVLSRTFRNDTDLMCHCIGVFSDAVASDCKLVVEEHCVTEYGHAVAQISSRIFRNDTGSHTRN